MEAYWYHTGDKITPPPPRHDFQSRLYLNPFSTAVPFGGRITSNMTINSSSSKVLEGNRARVRQIDHLQTDHLQVDQTRNGGVGKIWAGSPHMIDASLLGVLESFRCRGNQVGSSSQVVYYLSTGETVFQGVPVPRYMGYVCTDTHVALEKSLFCRIMELSSSTFAILQ